MQFNLFVSFVVMTCIACSGGSPKTEQRVDRFDEDFGEETIVEERASQADEKIILFFGNSLSAGYGLKEGESFPDRIQELVDENNLNYKVVNAGYSGETTAGGAGRIDWVLNQDIDIFVLELGGNDILRGIDVKNTEENLKSIIEKVRDKDPNIEIVLAGMQAPPNMGGDYSEQLAAVYPNLAKAHETHLIPFLLEKVGGMPDLNQPDGIHPNIEGAKVVANTVWQTLEPLL